MQLKRPMMLFSGICILSSASLVYSLGFICYVAFLILIVLSLFFLFKRQFKMFVFLVICSICFAYMPFYNNMISLKVQEISENKTYGDYTAIVERITKNNNNATIYVSIDSSDFSDTFGEKAVLKTEIKKPLPEIYDTIKFKGTLLPLDEKTLTSFELWGDKNSFYSKKCYFIADTNNYENLGRTQNPQNHFSLKYKYYYYITDRLKNAFPVVDKTDTFAYVIALLAGDRTKLEEDIYDTYKMSGMLPYLCISGLHVVLSCGILFKILNCLKLHAFLKLGINFLFLMFIYIVSGGNGSVVRACIMSGVFSLFNYLKTKSDGLSVLAFAFMIMYLRNPFCVFDYGTRLSFLAMLGLVAVSLFEEYYSENPKILRKLQGMLRSGFYAMGYGLPTVVSSFGGVYLLSPFSNIVASFVFTPIMFILVFMAFLTFLPLVVLKILAIPVVVLLMVFERISIIFASIPYSFANVVLPDFAYTFATIIFITHCFISAFCNNKKVILSGFVYASFLMLPTLAAHIVGLI